jgi:hypothetical protein
VICHEFLVLPVKLQYLLSGPLRLPVGAESNVLRGAFGKALRQVSRPAYDRIFEPVWLDGPSGYRNPPRPFVLRVPDQPGLAAGGVFRADLHLFDSQQPPWLELRQAFEAIGEAGLGPARVRARLQSFPLGEAVSVLRFPVEGASGSGRLRVRFASPTELKGEGEIQAVPDFATLAHRLAERVWALGCCYQGWSADWDYRELLDLGREMRLTGWEWARTEASRRSGSTGQTHSIGGFVGWAEYEGPVRAFVPLLEIGRWKGVGRQTVWGKGAIAVEDVRIGSGRA